MWIRCWGGSGSAGRQILALVVGGKAAVFGVDCLGLRRLNGGD